MSVRAVAWAWSAPAVGALTDRLLLLLVKSWVLGGIALALKCWRAGAVPGVVGAGLLVCVGVLALSEMISRPVGCIRQALEAVGVLGSVDERGARDELGQ